MRTVLRLPLRYIHRRFTSFSAKETATFERPTPIVLMSGEGCNETIWTDTQAYLSEKGYSGICIPYPVHCSTYYDMADDIQKHITMNKLTPPVLIAHSMSTYAAQKFLESYALSGLILVNPIPPYTAPAVISKLLQHYQQCIHAPYQISNLANNLTATCYYGINDPGIMKDLVTPMKTEVSVLKFNSDVNKFLHEKDNLDSVVNLENGTRLPVYGSVPTLLITSDGDRTVLTTQDMHDICSLHSIPYQEVLHLGSLPILNNISDADSNETNPVSSEIFDQSRIPMVTHRALFQESVYNWIESVT